MSGYIPEEVLIEILLKLSPKSLIRFTSVCKAWRSLIKSPSFISLHLANAENQFLLLKDYNQFLHLNYYKFEYAAVQKREPFSMKLIDFPYKCHYGIVGSCNGLLCFSNELQKNLKDPPHVIIWNPCIRNYVVLPRPLINEGDSPFVLGFGVASNIYKVVRLVFYGSSESILLPRAEIFTLGTTRWRKLNCGGIGDRGVRPNHQEYSCFFKGCLHWIATTDGNIFCENSILTFHVGEEIFGEIVLPDELERTFMSTLAVMGESLGGFIFRPYVRCIVWMMKDYGVKESWTKLYSIDCKGFNFGRIIGFLGSEEVLLTDDDHDELITYNAKTKGIKYGPIVEKINRCWYRDDFKESLVLLEGYKGEASKLKNL